MRVKLLLMDAAGQRRLSSVGTLCACRVVRCGAFASRLACLSS